MSDRILYFVISDDVYIFARFEDALGYYEVWNNSKDMLFDSNGKRYIFTSNCGNSCEDELVDLMNCQVEVYDGREACVISRIISLGYAKVGCGKTFKDICESLESRFGITE